MNNVIDLNFYKRSKTVQQELTRGERTPLYVSHNTGKIKGSLVVSDGPDFADRLARIRTSLDKINSLMEALKSMSLERKE